MPVRCQLTLWPVQKMGHFSHGSSRAPVSQVLRYGLRTSKGRTGGVSVEALATAASTRRSNRIVASVRRMALQLL